MNPLRVALPVLAAIAASSALADEGQIQLKAGAGRELVTANCATCHSLDYVQMNSPFLDGKAWEATVNKMIKVMGAPLKSEDVAAIVQYLATQYGKP